MSKLSDRSALSVSKRARPIRILASSLVIIVLVRAFLPDLVWLGAHKVTVTDIQPHSGLRFIGTLSDQTLTDENAPTGVRIDLVQIKKGGFLHKLDPLLEWSFAFLWLTALYDANYPAENYEIVTRLGPGGSLPADIAALGQGRFSIYNGHVLFSLPAGKTVDDIGRLDVWLPASNTIANYKSWPEVQQWIGVAIASAVLIALLWITPALLARNLGPGLAVTAAMIAIFFAAGELYMRSTGKFPKREIVWPVIFSPEVGVVFKPHSVVRYTNGFLFWTQDTTNSIGFMDAEPTIPKPAGTFRILLVGDSIVEALQVPLAQKTQTLLNAAIRNAYPDKKVDVFAISRSGLGQASELGLYNAYKEIKPDLVILMFVANDFANNSILLESIRSGFSPDHLPWWFATFDENKHCKMLPPSPDWDKYLLPKLPERIARLRSRSAEDARLVDGLLPEWVDSVFYRSSPLPEIYEQAVELTKCSFSLWKEAAERDGFKLLIVATEQVTLPNATGQIERLKRISDELQIPLFDVYPAWAKHGDIEVGRFPFDGHWTATGHRWSADAIFEYLISHGMAPGVDATLKE
ncbi:hypothetical protein ACFFWD_22755 [Bradyrhizobium erythrophlei]|uniref:hypothetical protein n=1 Tax=Bradyrhizobium erythrophlei TaxID=1437360 RepID=UPI0035EE43BA